MCQNNVEWVNALAFDLWKLSMGKPDYFYCMWVGFNKEYYVKALGRGESTPKFNCKFNMQLASDAYIISNPGLSFGGTGDECRLEFPSDMPTIQQDEPDVGVREVITADGGVATLARSTPMVLKPLEDPLEEDVLPPETPDEQ